MTPDTHLSPAGTTGRDVDVAIPTCDRPAALSVTLAGLLGQRAGGFRVVISDQGERPATDDRAVRSAIEALRVRGHEVDVHRHLPRRGMAEQRAFLLSQVAAPYVLFVDDDVLLEPEVVGRLRAAIEELGCGFVGAAVQGLLHLDDRRPHEREVFEVWEGPVRPERVRRGEPAWERWRLHNAANLQHLLETVALPERGWLAYKVAWVGACVMYRSDALRSVGGFDFWPRLPATHAGEDVVAELRVMETYGGAGILPPGAYHLQVPTTVCDRTTEAYDIVLDAEPDRAAG